MLLILHMSSDGFIYVNSNHSYLILISYCQYCSDCFIFFSCSYLALLAFVLIHYYCFLVILLYTSVNSAALIMQIVG